MAARSRAPAQRLALCVLVAVLAALSAVALLRVVDLHQNNSGDEPRAGEGLSGIGQAAMSWFRVSAAGLAAAGAHREDGAREAPQRQDEVNLRGLGGASERAPAADARATAARWDRKSHDPSTPIDEAPAPSASRVDCKRARGPAAWRATGIPVHLCSQVAPGAPAPQEAADPSVRKAERLRILGPNILTLTRDPRRVRAALELASLLGLASTDVQLFPAVDTESTSIRDVFLRRTTCRVGAVGCRHRISPAQVSLIASHLSLWAENIRYATFARPGEPTPGSPFVDGDRTKPGPALDPAMTAAQVADVSPWDENAPENAWILVFEDDAVPHPMALARAHLSPEPQSRSEACLAHSAEPIVRPIVTGWEEGGSWETAQARPVRTVGLDTPFEQIAETLLDVHPAVEFVALGACSRGFHLLRDVAAAGDAGRQAALQEAIQRREDEVGKNRIASIYGGGGSCTHAYAIRVRFARFLIGREWPLALPIVEQRSPLGLWLYPFDVLLERVLRTYANGLGSVLARPTWAACRNASLFRQDTHGLVLQRSETVLPPTLWFQPVSWLPS